MLGLKYSLLLSFICGVSVIIPYIGAFAVTIPIILVGYFQWGTSSEFWYVIIGHLIIQVVDGNIIVPILRKSYLGNISSKKRAKKSL